MNEKKDNYGIIHAYIHTCTCIYIVTHTFSLLSSFTCTSRANDFCTLAFADAAHKWKTLGLLEGRYVGLPLITHPRRSFPHCQFFIVLTARFRPYPHHNILTTHIHIVFTLKWVWCRSTLCGLSFQQPLHAPAFKAIAVFGDAVLLYSTLQGKRLSTSCRYTETSVSRYEKFVFLCVCPSNSRYLSYS